MNVKDLTNEELAYMLRLIKVTGISPSRIEEECLDEAADRLEEKGEDECQEKKQ